MSHAQLAQTLLNAASWETSQSGSGLHAIMRLQNKAAFAASSRKWTDATGNKHEFYTTGRFIAFGHCNWTRLDLTIPCDGVMLCIVPIKPAVATGAVDWDEPAPPVASEADRAARQFKETWPADFATVSDLKNFIGDDTPKSSAALGHLIERVGMKSGHRFTFGGRKETLLIVRGSLTADDFEKISAPILAEKINTARIQFSAL